MDDAAQARAATRDAIGDIAPAPLRDLLDARLRDDPMTPGVLVLLAARATGRECDPEEIERRAVGVQLIYGGLRLTRALSRDPPWEGDRELAGAGDLDVLAADVLVARGFYLLARTETASKAVETVRAFGRDETNLAEGRPDPELGGRTLEADVFEMAILAGVSATGAGSPPNARAFAVDLVRSFDRDLPPAAELLTDAVVEDLSDLVAEHDQTHAAPDRAWAGSSASDP